jgi:hypothetical protein
MLNLIGCDAGQDLGDAFMSRQSIDISCHKANDVDEKERKRLAAGQKRREKLTQLAATTERRAFSVPVFAFRNNISLR